MEMDILVVMMVMENYTNIALMPLEIFLWHMEVLYVEL